jgi:hypothetical protein
VTNGFVREILREILTSVSPSPARAIEPFKTPETALSDGPRIFPESPRGMLCFLDFFRQPFHYFQNRRGTFSLAVRFPRIGLVGDRWGCPRGQYFLRILRLLAPPVLLWSKKGAVAWLYSSLGNQSEIKRLFLESKLFPWIFTARNTLYRVCSLLRHLCHAGACCGLYR